MPLVPSSTPLTHFRLLSFDVYGTLVDWETGIATALLASPHLSSLPSSHPFKTSRKALLKAFETHERAIQAAHPNMLYSAVLGESYKQLVASLSTSTPTPTSTSNDGTKKTENDEALVATTAAAAAFSTSIASWPPFPDTLAALHALSAHCTLVPLTNTSNALFAQTRAHALAGAPFAAAYTAEDVGSYKPALANFEYLVARAQADFGVSRDRILHVAQSLWHDHVPAARLGLESVWVDRGGAMGGDEEGEEVAGARYAWRVRSLGELAERVEEAFREEGGKGEGV